MKELADQHCRFGHPRLHILLCREGFGANHKKTYRIYAEEKLQVRQRNRKRRCSLGAEDLDHLQCFAPAAETYRV